MNGNILKDITCYQTEELIDELRKRHDGFIFAGIRFTDTKGDFNVKVHKNGHPVTLFGLAGIINKYVAKNTAVEDVKDVKDR